MKILLIILLFTISTFAQLFSPYNTRAETDAYNRGKYDAVEMISKQYKEAFEKLPIDINKSLLIGLIEEYQKECTAEWRLYILIKNRVWVEPIRTDWRKCLEKEPTLIGFKLWLKKHLDID